MTRLSHCKAAWQGRLPIWHQPEPRRINETSWAKDNISKLTEARKNQNSPKKACANKTVLSDMMISDWAQTLGLGTTIEGPCPKEFEVAGTPLLSWLPGLNSLRCFPSLVRKCFWLFSLFICLFVLNNFKNLHKTFLRLKLRTGSLVAANQISKNDGFSSPLVPLERWKQCVLGRSPIWLGMSIWPQLV